MIGFRCANSSFVLLLIIVYNDATKKFEKRRNNFQSNKIPGNALLFGLLNKIGFS